MTTYELQTELIEEIRLIPADKLPELTRFIRFFRLGVEAQAERGEAVQAEPANVKKPHNLASLAGIVSGGPPDVSERMEEILMEDIDPVSGFSVDR